MQKAFIKTETIQKKTDIPKIRNILGSTVWMDMDMDMEYG